MNWNDLAVEWMQRAETAEAKVKALEAEAKVQRALLQAFREGRCFWGGLKMDGLHWHLNLRSLGRFRLPGGMDMVELTDEARAALLDYHEQFLKPTDPN